MTSDPANLTLPAGIIEADLVDLVDGCLARDREGIIVAAVSADPNLRALVGDMRRDRTGLSALATARAPAGLAESIEAKLQSEALRDLVSASEDAPASIPISTIRVQRPSILESVWPRRLALAATIALVAGGAVWGVNEIIRRNSPGPAPVEIAHATPAHEETPVIQTDPAPTDLAVIDNSTSVEVAMAPEFKAPEPAQPMTEVRALALARDGRLVITIHASAAQATMKRLDTLAKAGAQDGWKTIGLDRVPAEYAALTTPSSTVIISGRSFPDDRALASENPAIGSSSTPKTTPSIRSVVKAIYTADINPGDRWLSGLIRTITDALPENAVIELRESSSTAPAAAAVDPDSVLWWNAPPGKWARKTTIPIVIEALE